MAAIWYCSPLQSIQFYLIISLPHISFPPISLPVDDFRAHPVGGASDRLDACTRHADGLDTFAGSKVSQLHVSRGVSQDVSTWWIETKRAWKYSGLSRELSDAKGRWQFGVAIIVMGKKWLVPAIQADGRRQKVLTVWVTEYWQTYF